MLLPFLLVIPLAFGGTLWRLWQLLRGALPSRKGCRWARIGLTLIHTGIAGWLGWLIAYCIWPYQCGEGFASGYAAGAVGLLGAMWAMVWLVSEGAMLFCADSPASSVLEP